MRLAHFIQRYPPALGGSEAYFDRLSRYCAAHHDDVTVFTSNAVPLEAFWSRHGECLPAGIERDGRLTIRRYPLWRMPGRRWLLKALSLWPNRLWQCLTMPCNPISFDLWRDVRKEPLQFDAVHASAFPYAFPIVGARSLARRLDVPFFITPFLHLGDPNDPHDATRRGYTSPALRWLLNEADGVFVQTPSERAAAMSLGLPDTKIVLQGLGVDPEECTGGDRWNARQRWNVPGDAFVVGHLANNSFEKGTTDLLAALEPLWQQGRPIHLLLSGPEMPNFARFWQSFERRHAEHARKFVRRLGRLSDIEKRDFFASIDLFALPSRSDSFGLVLLEAWANGVPNVGYRAGGIADVIRHECDGLLVPCGDVAALAVAIARMHDRCDERESFGRAGRARLPIDFSWQEKLSLVRGTIEARIKKTRTEPGTRTLPALESVLESE